MTQITAHRGDGFTDEVIEVVNLFDGLCRTVILRIINQGKRRTHIASIRKRDIPSARAGRANGNKLDQCTAGRIVFRLAFCGFVEVAVFVIPFSNFAIRSHIPKMV